MLKNVLLLIITASLASCSFNSSDEKGDGSGGNRGNRSLESLKDTDTDGDLLTDMEEKRIGTNTKIADIPNVEISFLQNYSIELINSQDCVSS